MQEALNNPHRDRTGSRSLQAARGGRTSLGENKLLHGSRAALAIVGHGPRLGPGRVALDEVQRRVALRREGGREREREVRDKVMMLFEAMTQ
jgi:hypothetical protein